MACKGIERNQDEKMQRPMIPVHCSKELLTFSHTQQSNANYSIAMSGRNFVETISDKLKMLCTENNASGRISCAKSKAAKRKHAQTQHTT